MIHPSKGIHSVSIDPAPNLGVYMSLTHPELEGCVSGGNTRVGKVDVIVPSYSESPSPHTPFPLHPISHGLP